MAAGVTATIIYGRRFFFFIIAFDDSVNANRTFVIRNVFAGARTTRQLDTDERTIVTGLMGRKNWFGEVQ